MPWQNLLRRVALARGFLDPIKFIAQVQRFAQPSEVAAPVELLRLSAVLQARGILNSQAIQHNLDWIWPFWVQRQFDPFDDAFIPRAFSVTHINLSHRSWTALGIPGESAFPIVDPRGLVTPLFDGWSLDAWFLPDRGAPVLPSQSRTGEQHWLLDNNPSIETLSEVGSSALRTVADVVLEDKDLYLRWRAKVKSRVRGWLAVSLRPFNAEGVSFIESISFLKKVPGWKINGRDTVLFEKEWDRHAFSDYRRGDVFESWPQQVDENKISCAVGMASAAALWRVEGGQKEAVLYVPLRKQAKEKIPQVTGISAARFWDKAREGAAVLSIPETRFERLFKTSLNSLVLLAGSDVFPGPYTYRHFWYRDAVFILQAFLVLGLFDRAQEIIRLFTARQRFTGYFCSQDGEWDSNGQVLWAYDQFERFTGRRLDESSLKALRKGAKWLVAKRPVSRHGKVHAGLLPPGFSAEHLGPNDYYFWDNFWGIAGLKAAASVLRRHGDESASGDLEREASAFNEAVDQCIRRIGAQDGSRPLPSSPHRRFDSGSIGSLAADYPVRLWAAGDLRSQATADALFRRYGHDGGFFHDISHSGVNAYLSLHLAQVFLRSGDPRYRLVLEAVAKLASPTGQWPEAIHPKTGGGCMGDGQHAWASAEWIVAMRNLLVCEEGDSLLLGTGIFPQWWQGREDMLLQGAATHFGRLDLRFRRERNTWVVCWKGQWHEKPAKIRIGPSGGRQVEADPDQGEAVLEEVML